MTTPIQQLPVERYAPDLEGVFNLPEKMYHDFKSTPAISRGLVVELLQKSPAHAKCVMDGRVKKLVTAPMILGTLIDKALLTPDDFKEGKSHWVIPEGMKLSTKAGIAWKEEHPGPEDEGGLPRIKAVSDSPTVPDVRDIKEMIESVMRHRTARHIVENSQKQESAFCACPDTGIKRKCRPDARMVDAKEALTLVDLKSTFPGGASREAFRVHSARMMYHVQDSWYSDVYRDLFGESPWFLFMVVERKPPYAVRLFQIDSEGKQFARERYKRALESFRRCSETGIWPAYDEGIETISLPSWELNAPDPIEIE